MKIRVRRSTLNKIRHFFRNCKEKALEALKFVLRSAVLGWRRLAAFVRRLPAKTRLAGFCVLATLVILIVVLALTVPKKEPELLVAAVGSETDAFDDDDDGSIADLPGIEAVPDTFASFVAGEDGEFETDPVTDDEQEEGDTAVTDAENVLTEESFTQLKNGDETPEVSNIQLRLMELGYMDSDEPTERFGPLTESAVQSFQRHSGFEQTGVLDYPTYALLMSSEAKTFVMQLGDEGDLVESVQQRLYELGYLTEKSSITGTFGEKTESAVKDFQKKNKLSNDGKIGEKSMAKLYSEKCVSKTYSVGDKNSTIKSVKERLKKLGYYSGTVDDEFTKSLTTAIKRFQSQNDIVVDGKLGPSTKDKILSKSAEPYVMQLGNSGSDVQKVQDRLVKLNYLRKANATGYFGQKTVEAVEAFQSRNKLHSDGKVGSGTYNVLFSSSAKKAKSTSTSSSSSGSSKSSSSSGSSKSGSSSGSSGSTKATQNLSGIERLISIAESKLGCRYVRGAKGPDKFDCSGFVYYCLNQAGVRFSYLTSVNWRTCTKFTRISDPGSCKRGDVLVFSGDSAGEGHVGIYLGNGKMIDASSTEGKVRQTSSVLSGNYWKKHFLMGYRIF